MRNVLLIVCLLPFLNAGCDEQAMNKKGINVKGCVVDSLTKKPIPNAKLTLLCWYHAGWDKTDYVSIDTVVDKNGCFSAYFNRGYKVIVASVAHNYATKLIASEVLSNEFVEIDLSLRKSILKDNDTLLDINLREYIVQHSEN
jgi:hypothetical protein